MVKIRPVKTYSKTTTENVKPDVTKTKALICDGCGIRGMYIPCKCGVGACQNCKKSKCLACGRS